jgi:CRP-like cAMP-binding protein
MKAGTAELFHPPIIPWMEVKDQAIWDKALPLGHKVVWKNKSVIQMPEDEVTSIFLIRQGVIKVAAASSEGLQRTLWLMGPGSILGEAALFAHRNNSHHISAMEDCIAYEFSKQVVVGEILVRYPDLAEALLTNLATKSYIMSTQVEESAFLTAAQRLGRFLYGLCLARNSRHLPLSHGVIAELLGLHRVTVSNTISALKRSGLLEEHTHEIVVVDINALAAFLTPDS